MTKETDRINFYCPDCWFDEMCDFHKNPDQWTILTAKDFYPQKEKE